MSDASDANYKLGVDFKPNDDTLLYASWSQGFRMGRPVPANNLPVCDQDGDGFFDGSDGVSTGAYEIDSDFVDSYELGAKFTFLENRLQLNASIFQADWDGIPIGVVFDFCGATLNAGSARSKGVEVEGSYYLSNGWFINFGTSYVNAELTEDAPSLGAMDGDRLPGSPDFNFSLGLQYEFLLAGHNSFVRADYSYVGGFYNNLQQAGPEIGDYNRLNIRAGTLLANNLSVEVFANNITNDDALTWIDSEGFVNQRGHHLRPRTIGVRLGYQF